MVTVEIPPRYRGVTRGSKKVEVEASSVLSCLAAVESEYPGFHELVLDPKGEVRRFVRLFLNGDELPREDFDRVIESEGVLSVVTGAAGG